MNGILTAYLLVVPLLAATAIPVFVDCFRLALDANETAWNRRASFLWALLIWVVIFAWPIFALLSLLFWLEKERER